MKITKLFYAAFICLAAVGTKAQEVPITLRQADSLFEARNLEALAAKCNVAQAEAQLNQARLYSNPVVSLDENVYNRINKRYFDFGSVSEQVVGVDQLIYIAGQHANAVRLAKLSGEAAHHAFDELMRNLRGEMNRTFVKLYFAQQNLKLFQHEIISLHQVLDALKVQEEKGNISKIETARIQALLLSLRQEQNQYLTQASELEADLRVYVAMPTSVHLLTVFDPACLQRLSDTSPEMEKLQACLAERADVQLAQSNVDIANRQVKMERSKAFPEVHLCGQYDRNGGYFPNYFSVGVSLSVPIFNHNQGNIRSAKAVAIQNRYLYDNALQQAQNDLAVATEKLKRTLVLSEDVSKDFSKDDIETLFQGVNDNYRKRNISLLEFVDFYRTYKDAMLQTASIKQDAFIAIEDLNTAVGQTIIRY